MGLITEEVEVELNGNNVKYLESLGYEIPRRKDKRGRISYIKGQKIKIKPSDLKDKSNEKVDIQCDNDNCKKILKDIRWEHYKDNIEKFGAYYCYDCAMHLHGRENILLTKLKNSISFKQWCIDNHRQDLLDRWDYELNKLNPDEMCYSTSKKYYFKCPNSKHPSELKRISDITNIREGSTKCNQCNSFAQLGVDKIRENFLDKYWDYENNIDIDPWKIASRSNSKVWIKCQEKDYHGSYEITCNDFTEGNRCSYCAKTKVHPLDSLGTLHQEALIVWSGINPKSPFEYAPKSHQKVYWKCKDGKHDDYLRSIDGSNRLNFRCPDCNFSLGEEEISFHLINNNWTKISQDDYEKLLVGSIIKYYIPQKTFKGLIGVGNGLLSYDFYLPKYNLLIEFQGKQHEKPVDFAGKGKEWAEKQFEQQKEHDKRKREYAEENKIKLLEIWYKDFDNIETILEKELSLIK